MTPLIVGEQHMRMRTSAELKRLAKEKLNDHYGVAMGATALALGIFVFVYILIAVAFALYLIKNGFLSDPKGFLERIYDDPLFMIGEYAVAGVLSALSMTVFVGIIYICMKIDRGEEVFIKDLFYSFSHNPDKVIIIAIVLYLIGVVCMLPSLIVTRIAGPLMDTDAAGAMIFMLIYYLLYIAGIVAETLLSIVFSQVYILYLISNDEPVQDYFIKSAELMKDAKGRFLYLFLSFIGWNVLAVFTFGVLYIWLIPYECETMVLFHDELKRARSLEPGQRINIVIRDDR